MTKFINKKISFIIAIVMLISVFTITESFAAYELLGSNTFDNGVGLPWHMVVSDPAKASFDISGGKYKITMQNSGENRWDVQLRHKGLTLEKGRTYTVKFKVVSTKSCKIYAKIGDQGDPFREYWNYNKNFSTIDLQANISKTVEDSFTMNNDKEQCEFAFYIGGDLSGIEPYTVAFDDIYLTDPAGTQPLQPPLEPEYYIRVNQEGYFPNLQKIATYYSNSTNPVGWKLVNSNGNVVATGKTTVKGFDNSSGDNVHIIDFSSFTTLGTGYTLRTDNYDESMPFDIKSDLYTDLKYNALKYFYHNRSGTPIEMPYADSIELSRIATNPEDVLGEDPRESGNGNYTLDITGGWNNDDDDGKSVVNSGLATWTLMNQYEHEHSLYYGGALDSPSIDGTMNIPESGNSYPDILDEARYNLQTLLNMQVPAGNTLSGMVHHKVSSRRVLSSLGVVTMRFLQSPSTAATLNLAAVAAQGSRLWRNYDSAFSNKCLVAAETAWDAAIANPDMLVGMTSSTVTAEYGDDYVGDEFYWAACELYITTGKDKYLDYIKNSKHYLEMPTTLTGGVDIDTTGCFDWCNTAGMGTISLSLTSNRLSATDFDTAKANIIKAANEFISIANSQGYGVPIKECTIGTNSNGEIVGFPYSSNSYIVNEAIVMAYAYDLDYNNKYLNGIVGVMDYLLGRNPRNQSYITGYGDNLLENPHHFFWAYQIDNTLPKAPAGCLSSGPNSGLQDDWVKGSGWKVGEISPEKCFMDCAESWSTNDLDINLNAPLAWVSAYFDEIKFRTPPQPNPCGDVNGDGTVDALDCARIKMFLLTQNDEIITCKNNADINRDGFIDALDLALLKKFLLGSITTF